MEKMREMAKRIAELEKTDGAETTPEKPAEKPVVTATAPKPKTPSKEASDVEKKRPESQTSKSSKSSKGGKKK